MSDFTSRYDETGRRKTTLVEKPKNPLDSLTPEQKKEYMKQYSIGLSKGLIKDQAGTDAFSAQFVSGLSGGSNPSIYTEQPTSYSRSGNQTTQGNLSNASGVTPGGGYGTSNYDKAEEYLNTFEEPKTEEQIQQEKIKSAQDEINSINSYYNTLLEEQAGVNKKRESEVNAQSVLMGLSGSTEAGGRAEEAIGKGAKENRAIMAEKTMTVNKILSDIRKEASTEAQSQRENARMSAKDIMDLRETNRTKTGERVIALAGSGVTIDGLKSADPKTYQQLLDSIGSEEELKALFVLNKPKESVLSSSVIGKNYVVVSRNPITGAVTTESIDLGIDIPKDWATVDLGNKIVFYNKDNLDERVEMPKGLTPSQASGGAGGTGGVGQGEQLYSGLSSTTATAVRSKVSKFSTDPVVSNFSTIQEGYNFAKDISDTTKNPSDDQALIYAFAKVMDPGSVVREGEYATVQKYSQSWVNSFGKGVTQAINGTGFLSDTARANIKKTLKARYEASKSNYDNTTKNYTNSINSLTGRTDGKDFLTEYTNENIQQEQPQGGSSFDDISSNLTINDSKMEVYIPRDVWATLGTRKDALLKDVASDGYKLLIK